MPGHELRVANSHPPLDFPAVRKTKWWESLMRYLATVGFCLTAYFGLLIADNTGSYLLWSLILLVSPFAWFWVVGNRNQWRAGEFAIFLTMGTVGLIATLLWSVYGLLGYLPKVEAGSPAPMVYLWRTIFLLPFWASAGIAVMKLGGTLMAKLEPGTYNREYLSSLDGRTGHWFWGLLGIGWLIYQFLWLLRVL